MPLLVPQELPLERELLPVPELLQVLVLQPVPPHTTAAGVPARIVGKPDSDKPSMDMDQHFNGINHTFEYGDGI